MAREVYKENNVDSTYVDNQGGSKEDYPVKFFKLKDNGDSAIVRILHESPADYDVVSVHQYNDDKYFRKFCCLRSSNESIDKCPACKANRDNLKRSEKIYIHLLEYIQDPTTGAYKPVAKVFERPKYPYADKLNTLIKDYGKFGPLPNHLFRITRNGAANYTKTDYQFNYLPVQDQSQFPIDTSAFEGFDSVGTVVPVKTEAEIETFLATGKFPEPMQEIKVEQPTTPVGIVQPIQEAVAPQAVTTPLTNVQPVPGVIPQTVVAPAGGIPGVTLTQPQQVQNPYQQTPSRGKY